MATKLTKKALVATHDDINEVVGIEPPINEDLPQGKYEKELFDAVEQLELTDEEIEEFQQGTQDIIVQLKAKYGDKEEPEEEEEPAPKKKDKKVVEPEPDEEEEEEEEEELSLFAQIKSAKKLVEFKEIIAENKKLFKGLDKEKNVMVLKKKMLALVEPDEEEEEDETPTPKATKKGKKAPVVEDDEDEAPVKKKKEKKEKSSRGEGSMLVRKLVCKNPAITSKEIQKELEKRGLEQSPISINIRKMEMLHAIKMIHEFGLPKLPKK